MASLGAPLLLLLVVLLLPPMPDAVSSFMTPGRGPKNPLACAATGPEPLTWVLLLLLPPLLLLPLAGLRPSAAASRRHSL
jgi:hypothetical protein